MCVCVCVRVFVCALLKCEGGGLCSVHTHVKHEEVRPDTPATVVLLLVVVVVVAVVVEGFRVRIKSVKVQGFTGGVRLGVNDEVEA